MNDFVNLAKEAIEGYINNRKVIGVPDDLPPEFYKKKHGVFVSLHKNNELRGCIGTYFPVQKNLAQELIRNAIAASTQDPRFVPVSAQEINSLDIEVSILDEPERVKSINGLDPKKFGIIVKSADGCCGLLLPDLEGVDSANQQFLIACGKGGINPGRDKEIEIYRFTVKKFNTRSE